MNKQELLALRGKHTYADDRYYDFTLNTINNLNPSQRSLDWEEYIGVDLNECSNIYNSNFNPSCFSISTDPICCGRGLINEPTFISLDEALSKIDKERYSCGYVKEDNPVTERVRLIIKHRGRFEQPYNTIKNKLSKAILNLKTNHSNLKKLSMDCQKLIDRYKMELIEVRGDIEKPILENVVKSYLVNTRGPIRKLFVSSKKIPDVRALEKKAMFLKQKEDKSLELTKLLSGRIYKSFEKKLESQEDLVVMKKYIGDKFDGWVFGKAFRENMTVPLYRFKNLLTEDEWIVLNRIIDVRRYIEAVDWELNNEVNGSLETTVNTYIKFYEIKVEEQQRVVKRENISEAFLSVRLSYGEFTVLVNSYGKYSRKYYLKNPSLTDSEWVCFQELPRLRSFIDECNYNQRFEPIPKTSSDAF